MAVPAMAFCAAGALAMAGDAVYRRTIERVTSLDPADAASVYASRCVALVYEPLLEYDYSARPYALRPCLAAEMPEVSDDGLRYTFRIDTNATFTADACFGLDETGAPLARHVEAEDFVYSFKRLADEEYQLLKKSEANMRDAIASVEGL